jgi:2-iminobutanoate/2-iminopropanoate deaminase
VTLRSRTWITEIGRVAPVAREIAVPQPQSASSAMLFHMVSGGPQPVAPFSHAVEVDGFVFVTGQMPDTPDRPGVLPDGIEAQTRNVMANLATVLAGLGLGLENVVVARAFLTEFKRDYAAFNATYRSFFPPDRLPARTCVGTTGLAYDALVEIDLIAHRGGATSPSSDARSG